MRRKTHPASIFPRRVATGLSPFAHGSGGSPPLAFASVFFREIRLVLPVFPLFSTNNRLIGSFRRERLDHVIVINDKHLRGILKSYLGHYHDSRSHLSLDKDASATRQIQRNKSERIVLCPFCSDNAVMPTGDIFCLIRGSGDCGSRNRGAVQDRAIRRTDQHRS